MRLAGKYTDESGHGHVIIDVDAAVPASGPRAYVEFSRADWRRFVWLVDAAFGVLDAESKLRERLALEAEWAMGRSFDPIPLGPIGSTDMTSQRVRERCLALAVGFAQAAMLGQEEPSTGGAWADEDFYLSPVLELARQFERYVADE